MRVTYRGTRKGLSSKHNDRKFDLSKANHIDAEKTQKNFYWSRYSKLSFEETEKMAYKQLFSNYLNYQNQKHIARRQYKRVRTIDDILKNKNTSPEEFILQIGDMENNPGKNALGVCWTELFNRLNDWSLAHGEPFVLLNFALHGDEKTPHLHARRVWVATDPETGFSVPKQELALEQAGVPLPNPDKPKSRTNNRKITFDKMVRSWWQEICIEHGLSIETEPLPTRKHKDKETYVNEQIQAKQAELERLTSNLELARRLDRELSKEQR